MKDFLHDMLPLFLFLGLAFGAIYLLIYLPEAKLEARCMERGGLIWYRNGKACLLPPYNRLEIE